MSRKSRSQRRAILSATSALAIIVGLGGNTWAACTQISGNFAAFSNSVSLNCWNFNSATVTGNVTNTSTGTIGPPSSPAPGTVVVNSSTIGGSLSNSGQIN